MRSESEGNDWCHCAFAHGRKRGCKCAGKLEMTYALASPENIGLAKDAGCKIEIMQSDGDGLGIIDIVLCEACSEFAKAEIRSTRATRDSEEEEARFALALEEALAASMGTTSAPDEELDEAIRASLELAAAHENHPPASTQACELDQDMEQAIALSLAMAQACCSETLEDR